MLMIASSGRPWYWPEGSHNGLRPKVKGPLWLPEGQYKGHCTPLQATINLFSNWPLGSALNPEFNQAIKGFTRPLWILLDHYGSAIMGCTLQVI